MDFGMATCCRKLPCSCTRACQCGYGSAEVYNVPVPAFPRFGDPWFTGWHGSEFDEPAWPLWPPMAMPITAHGVGNVPRSSRHERKHTHSRPREKAACPSQTKLHEKTPSPTQIALCEKAPSPKQHSSSSSRTGSPTGETAQRARVMLSWLQMAREQAGSRIIQEWVESGKQIQLIFQALLPSMNTLMQDMFGNYVVQKYLEFGTPEQRFAIVEKLQGKILALTLHMYGCRVVQKALETLPPSQQAEIISELEGNIIQCVKDQNGNHVVQKSIECVDPILLNFVIKAFKGQVSSLASHCYGCRVIQRVLEHCNAQQTSEVVTELHEDTEKLVKDQYGNYVIQHVLEHGLPEDRSRVVNRLKSSMHALSQHKFASNVVEKCIIYGSRQEREQVISEVCSDGTLYELMSDPYGNYVIQTCLEHATPRMRKMLLYKIQPYIGSIKGCSASFAKFLVVKIEHLNGNPSSGRAH